MTVAEQAAASTSVDVYVYGGHMTSYLLQSKPTCENHKNYRLKYLALYGINM